MKTTFFIFLIFLFTLFIITPIDVYARNPNYNNTTNNNEENNIIEDLKIIANFLKPFEQNSNNISDFSNFDLPDTVLSAFSNKLELIKKRVDKYNIILESLKKHKTINDIDTSVQNKPIDNNKEKAIINKPTSYVVQPKTLLLKKGTALTARKKNISNNSFILRNTYKEKKVNSNKNLDFSKNKAQNKININTAAKTEFIRLLKIDAGTAQKIITYRERFGNFKSLKDFFKVPGLNKYYYRIKNKISVVTAHNYTQ